MRFRWFYFAAVFIVLLLMVIADQMFDAMKGAGIIGKDSMVIKSVGWILLGLLVLSGLSASRYWSASKRLISEEIESRNNNRRLLISMISTVLLFAILLTLVNIADIGRWIFYLMYGQT